MFSTDYGYTALAGNLMPRDAAWYSDQHENNKTNSLHFDIVEKTV
jgi:hypothetical protein